MVPMQAAVVTLFPEVFGPFLAASVLGRARERGLVRIDLVDLRLFGEGPHRVVDDRPFGGGPGMVLMAEPVVRAVETARALLGGPTPPRTILLSPQGRRFTQADARALAAHVGGFVLVAGRYEGIDERAVEILSPEEFSIGDFVLSGGEVAAMAVLDAVARLVPGVLGDERSPLEESFGEEGILDHPHYTRPAVVRGLPVPEVLRSGDHGAIARWRREEAMRRTRERRPDLLGSPREPG
jgi:tRNA (guanine37-N1)-methyltransferase